MKRYNTLQPILHKQKGKRKMKDTRDIIHGMKENDCRWIVFGSTRTKGKSWRYKVVYAAMKRLKQLGSPYLDILKQLPLKTK